MITIDALGKNGCSVLPDLEGTSPTGGLVTTQWRGQYALAVGDLVRAPGGWGVIADIRHNGILGCTTAGVILPDGTAEIRSLWGSGGAVVRTDARIDPDTLWRLAELPEQAARDHLARCSDPFCAACLAQIEALETSTS
jgi:hypothetical protein